MKISKRQLKRIIREEKQKFDAKTKIRQTIRRVIREANEGSVTTVMLSKEPYPGVSSFELPQMYRYGNNASDTVDAIINDFGAYTDKSRTYTKMRKQRRYKKEDTRELVAHFETGIRDAVDAAGGPSGYEINYKIYLPFITSASGYRAEEINQIISSPEFKQIAQGFAKGLYDQNYKVIKKKKASPQKQLPVSDLVKFSSSSEVMNAVHGYYQEIHGPEAGEFIQGNPTIQEFIFNDPDGIEDLAETDLGNLVYDPNANSISTKGGQPGAIPGDLASMAKKFYNQGQYLADFLHLITLSDPRSVVFTPDGQEIYNE